MQSTSTKYPGQPAAAGACSSRQTSISSVTRDDDDDDDDDDDEVRMINRRQEFVEADSGLVPDLLAADADFDDHDQPAPPCWLLFKAV